MIEKLIFQIKSLIHATARGRFDEIFFEDKINGTIVRLWKRLVLSWNLYTDSIQWE